MANMNKTKKEMADIIDKLKAELLELKNVQKVQQVAQDELVNKAFGIARVAPKDYRVVEINYDADKNQAVIVKTHKVEPNAPHMVSFRLNELMQAEVRKKMEEML
tara:strand:+ start:208 stop:522 length:315 start_codon:yes stop_codon:yes gene_type:complete